MAFGDIVATATGMRGFDTAPVALTLGTAPGVGDLTTAIVFASLGNLVITEPEHNTAEQHNTSPFQITECWNVVSDASEDSITVDDDGTNVPIMVVFQAITGEFKAAPIDVTATAAVKVSTDPVVVAPAGPTTTDDAVLVSYMHVELDTWAETFVRTGTATPSGTMPYSSVDDGATQLVALATQTLTAIGTVGVSVDNTALDQMIVGLLAFAAEPPDPGTTSLVQESTQKFTYIESTVTDVRAVTTVDRVDVDKTQCYIGVQFFSDAAGTIPVTPGAGTVTLTVKTLNSNVFETFTGNTITAATPTTVPFTGNVKEVLATPSGVTTASYYKVVVTCNRP